MFILNRSPMQSVNGRTLYEVWHGTKPIVTYLHTFGCVAHIKQGNKMLTKLEDCSTMMVFIGYEPGSKAWRFYNPVTKRVHVSHNAIFEKTVLGSGTKMRSGMVSRSRWSVLLLGVHIALSVTVLQSSTRQTLWQGRHQGARQCPCTGLNHAHLLL
jgi:hypothetical protein